MISATKSQKLYSELKDRCKNGYYSAGSQLPKEVELAEEMHVSRKTLRLALDQLSREKLIIRLKGKGTFVPGSTATAGNKMLVILNDYPDISNPYPYIMPGIQSAAAATDILVDTCMPNSFTALSREEAVQSIRDNAPDGIILMGNNFRGNERLLDILQHTGIPVLLPHAATNDHAVTGFATMSMDYRQIILDGLLYLKAQGHKRIGIMMREGRGILHSEYASLAEQAGINGILKEVPYSYESVAAWLEEILGVSRPPTALFCYSDFYAIHAYRYLKQAGINIPKQLSVLSIGGHIGCNYLTPTLSAIDFNLSEIGSNAVRLLMDIIYDKKYAAGNMPEVICPHHIIERQSTGIRIEDKDTSNIKEMLVV